MQFRLGQYHTLGHKARSYGGILVIVRHFMSIILCACAFTPSKAYAQHGLASNRLRAGADRIIERRGWQSVSEVSARKICLINYS